jgi:GTP-binding protein EngB required for normal cell division
MPENDLEMLSYLATEANQMKLENVDKTIYQIKMKDSLEQNGRNLSEMKKEELRRTYAFLLATTEDDPRVAKLKLEGLKIMTMVRVLELRPAQCRTCDSGKAFFPRRDEVPKVSCRRCRRPACPHCYGEEEKQQARHKWRYLCTTCDDLVCKETGEAALDPKHLDKAYMKKHAKKADEAVEATAKTVKAENSAPKKADDTQVTMGEALSRLIDMEKTSWSKPHALETNQTYAVQQCELIDRFFKVGSTLQLCCKIYPMEYPGAGGDKYQHWFVTTSDDSWVVQFGEFCQGETDLIVAVHSNPKGEYTIEDTFTLTSAVLARIKRVVGATNYSVALRNCEHVARYIQTGSWVSFQMSGKGILRKMYLKEMAAYTKMINKLPLELKEAGEEVRLLYEENESSGRIIFQVMPKAALTLDDDASYNILFLGPTGSGKSTLINLLCNRSVNKAAASVHSVTRELQYIQGKLRKVLEDGSSNFRRTNIIDTIGFCDSVFTPKQVLDVIKSSVKVNLCHIDKVVVVCSGRIESHHVQAIQQFLKWLQYKKHRNQFVFIYNKADHCDSEEQRVENVAGMLELLGAKQVTRTMTDDLEEGRQEEVKAGLSTGFPKKATYEEIEDDYNKLWRAITYDDRKYDRIQVSKESCSIL